MEILDILQTSGSLTRRRARDYVLEALYLGTELLAATPEYESFVQSVYADLGNGAPTQDRPVSAEGTEYLREILQAATGGSRSALSGFVDYDGFSEAAYQEVSRLLGREGRSYLGISGPIQSLMPSRSRVSAFLADDELARTEVPSHRVSIGPPPLGWDDPYPYPWEPPEMRTPLLYPEEEAD